MGVQQGAERTRVKKALGCRAGELGLDQRVIFLLPQPVRQRHGEAALRRVGQLGRQAAGRGGAQGDLLCRVVVETPVGLNEKQKQLLKELQESFGGPTGENNSPRSKSFFDGVKKFFDDLTR